MELHILIVEDDVHLAELIEMHLQAENYKTTKLVTGKNAKAFLKTERPHLIILDRNLPDMDGVDLCLYISQNLGYRIPVIILTVQNRIRDRIVGLEAGASDYIAKPVDMNELKARVKAQLRSYEYIWISGEISYQGLLLNQNRQEAYYKQQPLNLNPKEFRLLFLLIRFAEHVVSKSRLFDFVWEQAKPISNSLEVYISSLRRKFKRLDIPLTIENAYGEGYLIKPYSQ